MQSTMTFPQWLISNLHQTEHDFEEEASKALTEAMRAFTPQGLPHLIWLAYRGLGGGLRVEAEPEAFEVHQQAEVFSIWQATLQGPAMVEHTQGDKLFKFVAERHLAGVDFKLSFTPCVDDGEADEVRQILADAIMAAESEAA